MNGSSVAQVLAIDSFDSIREAQGAFSRKGRNVTGGDGFSRDCAVAIIGRKSTILALLTL
jgi:hypothetical protein